MKLPNPLKVDRSTTEDFGYVYYFRIVAAAALLSVIGNITAYALDELPLGVIWAIHALPPLIAVLMLHTFATIRASFMGAVRRDPTTRPAAPWAHLPFGQRVAAWLRSWNLVELALAVTLAVLVGAVLVITLAVSFVSLAVVGEMAGWHGRVAWALPLMLDLPAFAATIGFLKAGHRMSQEASAVELLDDHRRHADELGPDTPTSSPVEMPVEFVDRSSTGAVEIADDVVQSPSSSPVELVDDLVDTLTASAVDTPTSSPDEHRRHADEVVATSKISAAADELAIVLALDAEGLSKQAIADRVGRSRSTVTGWIKAAESVRPQLELVGGRSVGNE